MSYQTVAYTFLKTLYADHIKSNSAICSYDFEKFREVSKVEEPDGILDLIVSYLRGNGLIHSSLPISATRTKTYHISLRGIECIRDFENSTEFKINSKFSHSFAPTSTQSINQKESSIAEPEFISEKLCQIFFLKFI